jgi:hypothetical protein
MLVRPQGLFGVRLGKKKIKDKQVLK